MLERMYSIVNVVYCCLSVLHSGEYYLFESDSEEDEELQADDQKPQKQTACQVSKTTYRFIHVKYYDR